MTRSKRRWTIILASLVAIAVYMQAAFLVYAINHPHFTQTQLLMRFWDIMTWAN